MCPTADTFKETNRDLPRGRKVRWWCKMYGTYWSMIKNNSFTPTMFSKYIVINFLVFHNVNEYILRRGKKQLPWQQLHLPNIDAATFVLYLKADL